MATRDLGGPPSNAPDFEKTKWEFLKNAPFRDAKHPAIVKRARALREATEGSPWPGYAFVCLAHAMAKDAIVYQLDTDRVGREQIDGFTDPQGAPDVPFTRGVDDCDGKARFFVSLCIASGIRAEMVDRWDLDTGRLAHVYARVYVFAPNTTSPAWFSVETILRRARIGDVAEHVPKEPETGKWSQ